MLASPIRRCCGTLALALLLIAPRAFAMDGTEIPATAANAYAQASPQAVAEYKRKL
jgi:tRNA(Leu) C34 or U34 (ribose-2'-O)-methylase TrmL